MDIALQAQKIRQLILKTACFGGGGHIAPALSMADIMAVLYFDGVLKYDAHNPKWDKRDIFVLSKGHACLALYASLALAGFFPQADLRSFLHSGSRLGGHPDMHLVPGVEASTGALGHGLLFAEGIAIANKLDNHPGHVYALLGDGECEEGSVWEGFMAAAYHRLDNLTVIIDHNKFQAMDTLVSILGLEKLGKKLDCMGFAVAEINGHDCRAIKEALLRREKGRPMAIVAHTIKGKGISYMEGKPLWHCRMPNAEELATAMAELGLTREEMETL